MAQRDREKPKRGAVRTVESVAGISDAMQRLEAEARKLERERDGLLLELEAARARIKVLESTQTDVANRIEWVIDSLHNLSDKPT
jgi:chromosome segregation ATPase